MNQKIKPSIKILITKKITDSLSEREQKKLEAYMQKNYSAIQYHSELLHIWNLVGKIKMINQVNLNTIWTNLCKRMSKQNINGNHNK